MENKINQFNNINKDCWLILFTTELSVSVVIACQLLWVLTYVNSAPNFHIQE